jgi:hypothetical protein
MATRSTRGLFSVVIDRIYSMVKVVIYDEAGNTAGVTAGGELKTTATITGTVTGTVTANAGTNLNTSLLATEATLALIKAKTDNIPSDPSKESGKLASIDSALSTLSAKLDNLEPADTITEYSITCTNANTEYSQALPAGTKKIFYINTADYPWRASYVTGKVATPTHPYEPIGAGISGSDDGIFLTSKTLYVASTHAGDVIFVRCWT